MNDTIISDLRYAARTLFQQPGISLLAILTLGLSIGANATIFSAFNSLLLRQPPFRDPDRVVRITSVRGSEDGGALSVPELDDLRALPVFEDVAMYTDQAMYNASGFGEPEELQATITTHNLFRMLGVEPLIGSTFPAAFDRTRNFGVVISHGLWIRKFGGSPDIVGRTMTLDGAPGYTIFGVMPPHFNFPSHSDLFRAAAVSPPIPLSTCDATHVNGTSWRALHTVSASTRLAVSWMASPAGLNKSFHLRTQVSAFN